MDTAAAKPISPPSSRLRNSRALERRREPTSATAPAETMAEQNKIQFRQVHFRKHFLRRVRLRQRSRAGADRLEQRFWRGIRGGLQREQGGEQEAVHGAGSLSWLVLNAGVLDD